MSDQATTPEMLSGEEMLSKPAHRQLLEEVRRTVTEMELHGFQPFQTKQKRPHTFQVVLAPVLDDDGLKYFRSVSRRAMMRAAATDQGVFVEEARPQRSLGDLDAKKVRLTVTLNANVSGERGLDFCRRLSEEICTIVENGVMALKFLGR